MDSFVVLTGKPHLHRRRSLILGFAQLQAQELGEQARLQDDTMWALEGLNSNSIAAQKDSLGALAEIYANRRSRLAVHTSAVGREVLRALGTSEIDIDVSLLLSKTFNNNFIFQP